ncbi:hypothetical protein SAMN05892883_2199 [Jatrophihabitans sp. GAS493]|uniref:hypothetical protein n=1 Tax=Jatrophihabitans sp. GAS493 TaxID=1907575 RepID=UPI000BBFF036|nr:hypothetical protein [Jatrophihabitans sp. GAS493]SOD72881.1 hypothetical protein SAMN05892883_2199 [Jatrophihabitans sp. GAS493]
MTEPQETGGADTSIVDQASTQPATELPEIYLQADPALTQDAIVLTEPGQDTIDL